ncbi:Retrovirus-related Pol polyprotein from transposon TNT 1-94-like protein [Drosera capensis]
MDQVEWNLLDLQVLGVVRLTLANKRCVQHREREDNVWFDTGAIKHVREAIDIEQGTVTAVASTSGTTKLTFNGIRGRISEKRQNSERGRLKSKKRGQSKPRKDITCWNCQKKGHFRRQCIGPKEMKPDTSVNVAQEDVDDGLICCVKCPIESWIMDFGALFHGCNVEFQRNFFWQNYEILDITGMRDINLRTSAGTVWTLKDVRYIPGLKRMLISMGMLDAQGYRWKVVKGNLVIARGWKKNTLYMVELSTNETNTIGDDVGKCSTLWHQRLKHMTEKGMKMLVSKGKISELKEVKVGFCEPCVFGKQKRVTFVTSGRTPKAEKLELVHTDVYGPTSVPSLGGSRYYVTFIYDSTRKWKVAVENETGLKIKCLKSNNGGEYSSSEFIDYCIENGIRMLKTIPKTPQQNSVVERMNMTLNERAKSMRIHAGLPKIFWADSVSTAAYLINRGPSVPMGFKIPEEE